MIPSDNKADSNLWPNSGLSIWDISPCSDRPAFKGQRSGTVGEARSLKPTPKDDKRLDGENHYFSGVRNLDLRLQWDPANGGRQSAEQDQWSREIIDSQRRWVRTPGCVRFQGSNGDGDKGGST